MIRRPPRSTLDRSSAASDVYKRQHIVAVENTPHLHNMVVCTLCSCYPWPVLGLPPVWLEDRVSSDLQPRQPGHGDKIVKQRAYRLTDYLRALINFGSPGGMRWLDCEVVKNADGDPAFRNAGSVAARAEALGIRHIHLSISHDGGFATAMVVCEA